MHGYFLSLKLYDTARAIANPFAYAEHREKMVREKMEKMSESRIRAPKNMSANVKVNKALADRVAKDERRTKARLEKKQKRAGSLAAKDAGEDMEVDHDPDQPSLMSDPRFSALFEDPQFEVDEGSREFALMNPSLVAKRLERQLQEDDQNNKKRRTKTAVEEEEEDQAESLSSEESESDGDELDDDDSSENDGNVILLIRSKC
jgi:ribosome biogenesis protein ENP2